MSDKRLYILYDGRACGNMGTDDAQVLCTAWSVEDAKRDQDMFGECACYSYDASGTELTDERWEGDWLNGIGFTGIWKDGD